MRVWVDIENPPQVRYLLPCARALAKSGVDVVITARDYGSTFELLRSEAIGFYPVGSSFGKSKPRKVIGVVGRSRGLVGLFRELGPPDAMLSASRAAALTTRALGIPGFTISDYEHVNLRIFGVARIYTMFPDVIDARAYERKGLKPEKLIPFRGLKEDISFSGIDIDATPAHVFPRNDDRPIILFRPPAEESHYYQATSKELALDLLRHLATESDSLVIFSPRYPWQRQYLDRLAWATPPVVLETALPFVSLLKGVDAVISSGGTMVREAAYLGIPAFSILQSAIGDVDRYLERIGRLTRIASPEDFPKIDAHLAVHHPVLQTNPHLVDEVVEHITATVRTRVPRSNRHAKGTRVAAVRPVLAARSLERLLAPTEPVRVVPTLAAAEEDAAPLICSGAGPGEPTWLRNRDWQILARVEAVPPPPSAEILHAFDLPDGARVSVWRDKDRPLVFVPFDLDEAYRSYISEAWRASGRWRALSPRQLDLFYRTKRLVPRRVQLTARRALVRWQGAPDFPEWPFDSSVISLLRFYAFCLLSARGVSKAAFRWFWPDSHRAALILTHDVETADGLRLALEIADLEEERGFRSSFNVGGWYGLDLGILRELEERGFEVGVHGLRHDRSLFASRAAFEDQQAGLAALRERVGGSGFRSPSTHRFFDWLGELPFLYDCSVPHSDPFEPQPGGCCSVWPFLVGSLVELPYTLPQDHTLFTLLRARSIAVWLEQVEKLEAAFGLVQCVTHPDPGYLGEPKRRALYAEFLTALAERDGLWRALPSEVAEWWRLRDEGAAPAERVSQGFVKLGETPTETLFEPPAPRAEERAVAPS